MSLAVERFQAVDLNRPGRLADFVRFASHMRTERGTKLVIEPFQRKMLRDYFAGTAETVIVIPKKNGKTTLLGALALYHLARQPNAECLIGASSRDQATILFNQASGLVRRSSIGENFVVLPGYREIRLAQAKDAGRIRVMAADAATADGVIPTLALVDELHRHPSGELYGVFRDGLGPRKGRMVTISTAGATLGSPLGVLRTKAHDMPGFTRNGAYNHVRSPNKAFALHEWALSDTDDTTDIDVVKTANPASWQTVEALRSRFESPTTTPGQWLRFACGIWTEGDEPWLSGAAWDRLADPGMEIEPGADVVVSVDMGERNASAAIVIVTTGEQMSVKAELLGDVGFHAIEERIRELRLTYNVVWLLYDSLRFARSAETLEAEGMEVLDVPQRPERMTLASASIHKAIVEGRLIHDGSPELRRQVLAARVKETERGWRIAKDIHAPRPIDALVAMAVAVQVIATEMPDEPMFGWS